MEIEKRLEDRDLIVSSTDKNGIICYVNSKFSEISEYTKQELYGKPHNIIRHSDMPKAIFKYIWNNLLAHKPVVGYVKNYIKGEEKYYWVKAVMYPKIQNNEISIITSYRTKANDFEIDQIKEIYKTLIEYERTHTVEQSMEYFIEYLNQKNLTYDKMINRLNDSQQILNIALLNLDLSRFKIDHMIFRSRIESLVEKGYENVEVVKPTCCAFGKRLAELENESFAKDSKFSEIKTIHNRVHSELQQYVDASESEKKSHMDDVYKDIDKLFKIMEELKNDHKHDKQL
jgi:PAS domain S-box-containing protein